MSAFASVEGKTRTRASNSFPFIFDLLLTEKESLLTNKKHLLTEKESLLTNKEHLLTDNEPLLTNKKHLLTIISSFSPVSETGIAGWFCPAFFVIIN
ncbi:MAG TPA: hypothetical protein VJL58_10325 [Pyrinomonadaceae bacterium]|nr:hypothetical protein [Pyrinomonadaceae bacterium]